jgi:hypothetical protein
MIHTSVPIPKKMKGLGKDHRGYPIPFIVLRDANNKPQFAANNSLRQLQCLLEKRCPICGTKLDRLLWFLGGPLSAFHTHGKYRDTAMHHECMTYAVQVCPWLAAPQYLGHIDTEKVASKLKMPLADITMIPDRPPLFVAVASLKQEITFRNDRPDSAVVAPVRPYVAVEFWRHGKQLSESEGQKEVELALAVPVPLEEL